jgi:hypothetical protein
MAAWRSAVLVAVGVTAAVPAAAAEDVLSPLRWKARPVIVLAERPDDPRLARQLALLEREKKGVEDRGIAVLRESGRDGPLRRRLGLPGAAFAVALVGKDGGVKEVWHAPVAPRRIFTVIDAMPMRRDEMKG